MKKAKVNNPGRIYRDLNEIYCKVLLCKIKNGNLSDHENSENADKIITAIDELHEMENMNDEINYNNGHKEGFNKGYFIGLVVGAGIILTGCVIDSILDHKFNN